MTVDIRPAVLGDIEASIELMREFQGESLGFFGFEVKADKAQELVKQFIDSSLVAVSEGKVVGVIAGTINTFPLDGSKVFQEVVWYVSKQYRFCGIALFKALEIYCKRWGISHIVMVNMANLKSDKLNRFYKHMGFQELEVHYIKTLGA